MEPRSSASGGIVILNSIQVLRAYAAIAVMIGHTLFEADATFGLRRTHMMPWTAGVHIFFVISGFILTYTNAEAFGSAASAKMFVKRRVQRIVPLYWLFTTLVLLTLLVGAELRSTVLDWPNAVASYLFWPEARPGGQVVPLLSVGWTLNYEILFYALFAVSLLFARQSALLGLTGLFVSAAIIHPLVPDSMVQLKFWTDPIVLEFIGGVWLGIAFARVGKRHASVVLWAIMTALGFGLLLAVGVFADRLPSLPSWVAYGVPSVIIVGSAAFLFPAQLEARVPRLLILLGNSSFALYLSHRFPLRIVTEIGRQLAIAQPAVYVAVSIISCLAVAVLTHLIIERPMMMAFRGRAVQQAS
jgi:peptidoglycan/LPS O-acetylase OafA/YrhL